MIARLLSDTFSRGHVIGEGDDRDILLGGSSTAAGERVSEATALKVAAVYSCVAYITSAVSLMPLHVRQDIGDGILRDDRDSRLWGLLHDQPNPEMSAGELWEWVVRCLLLRGNAYLYLQRGRDGRVEWLMPIHPRRVTVDREPRSRRKVFTITAPDNTERVEFYGTTDDIIHIKGPGGNSLVGQSVISFQRETIGRALAEDRHASTTLKNGGRPSGILKVKGKLDDDAAKRLSEQWKASHGRGKSGGTAVLEEDTEWEAVTMTASDMELVKQRATSREDIANAFQMPGDMVMAGSQANLHYSSDESRDVRFVKYAVLPWTGRVQGALEICERLPWRFEMDTGRRVPRFNPAALLMADMKTRYEAYKIGLDAGFLVPDEPRKVENLEPIPGGDKPTPRLARPADEKRDLPPTEED